jgi:hypothetical protein
MKNNNILIAIFLFVIISVFGTILSVTYRINRDFRHGKAKFVELKKEYVAQDKAMEIIMSKVSSLEKRMCDIQSLTVDEIDVIRAANIVDKYCSECHK